MASVEYVCIRCGAQGLARPTGGESREIVCGACGARVLTVEPRETEVAPTAEKVVGTRQ